MSNDTRYSCDSLSYLVVELLGFVEVGELRADVALAKAKLLCIKEGYDVPLPLEGADACLSSQQLLIHDSLLATHGVLPTAFRQRDMYVLHVNVQYIL